MVYKIVNSGGSRDIYYKGEMYYITRNGFLETTDRGLAVEASKLPFISFNDNSVVRRVEKKATETIKQKSDDSFLKRVRKKLIKI